MELWCRIPREDLDDLAFLNSEGLETELKKGCIDAKFKDHKGYIADFPVDTIYQIKLWEYGGGMAKTGKATVICDIMGGRLKPSKIITTGHLSNKIHAEFKIQFGHYISSTKNGSINIDYVQIMLVHDSVKIFHKHIWHGVIENLPAMYDHFKCAVKAAYTKANMYHCRVPCYIL